MIRFWHLGEGWGPGVSLNDTMFWVCLYKGDVYPSWDRVPDITTDPTVKQITLQQFVALLPDSDIKELFQEIATRCEES